MIIVSDTDLDSYSSRYVLFPAVENSGLVGVPLYDMKSDIRRRLYKQIAFYWNKNLEFMIRATQMKNWSC